MAGWKYPGEVVAEQERISLLKMESLIFNIRESEERNKWQTARRIWLRASI